MSVARRLSVLPSVGELGQAPRYARGGQGVDFGFHDGLARGRVGCAVGAW